MNEERRWLNGDFPFPDIRQSVDTTLVCYTNEGSIKGTVNPEIAQADSSFTKMETKYMEKETQQKES